MILNLYQTKTSFDMEWQAADTHNREYAAAAAPFDVGRFTIRIRYADGFEQCLYYNPMDTTWGSKLAERLSFKMFEQGDKVGQIIGKTKKTGFLKGYPYYEFDYKEARYYGYEVGFGKKGLYLCIYRGNTLIAIADKTLRVINFKDTYSVYLEDAEYASIVVPFVIYYDMVAYGDVTEVALRSVKEKRVYTKQQELIEKYDSTFIPRIKAMDDR